MAIEFVQAITPWAGESGSGGLASSAFTPSAAGDSLLIFGTDTTTDGKTLSFSSSAATTYATPAITAYSQTSGAISQVLVQGANNISDQWGQTISVGYSLAAAAGSQTASVKSSTTSDNVLGFLLDYSGVGHINTGLLTYNNPASLSAPAIGIPAGSFLVALCISPSSSNAITNTNGTLRASGTTPNGNSYCVSEFAGGQVVSPAWTMTDSTSNVFDLVFWLLTPTGGTAPLYIVQSIAAVESSAPWSCTLPSETTVGNVIVAVLAGGGGGGASTPFPLTQFDDDVNAGSYTQFNLTYNSTVGMYAAFGYQPVTVAGTTKVTVDTATSSTGFLSALEIGGWNGNVPAVDAAASVNASGTSATEVVDVSSNYASEILFCAPWNNGTINGAVTGWQPFGAAGDEYDNNYYAPLFAAQANNFSGDLGTAVAWLAAAAGIYSATPASGQIAGTAGLSLGASGALQGMGAIAGSVDLTLGASAALAATGAIEGSGAIAFTASYGLTALGALVGSAGATLGDTATIRANGVSAGTAGLLFSESGTLTGLLQLTGSGVLSLDAVGTPSGLGTLAGSGALDLSATGTLSVAGSGSIAGTAGISFSGEAIPSATAAITGDAGVAFGQSGRLTGLAAISATGELSLTASGSLTAFGVVRGIGATSFAGSGLLAWLGAIAGAGALELAASGTLSAATGSDISGSAAVSLGGSATLGLRGSIDISDEDVYAALAGFFRLIVPGNAPILRGQQNRIPMPSVPFVLMTTLGEPKRIGTNDDDINPVLDADGNIIGFTLEIGADYEYRVQADFYSPRAQAWATAAELLWRDGLVWTQMPTGIKPLYSEDGPRQTPLVGGENQWIQRWTLTLVLDYRPTWIQPTLAATSLTIVPMPIEVFFPTS